MLRLPQGGSPEVQVTGQFVGPYRVLDTLGSGGMGDVFLAEDVRLGRRVALKRPSQAWLSLPDARARLHREASAAAALTHPHIAAIYDVLDIGAEPYIVMEYVEGESLARVLQRGRLPIEQAVQVGMQLADALVAAHDRGVVHRDLKPGNVCMAPDGRVKILDFGIASARKPATGGPNAPHRLTVPGQFMGTPGYSSPEQLAGAAASPRDDIYALGVLLFEVLTGRRPFEADNALDLAVATMTRTAPAADELNPAVPPELSALVARALARDPRDRVASAAAFHAELRRLADGLASGPTGEHPAVPSRPRRRTPVLAATALVAVASVGTGIWLVRAPDSEAHGVPVVAVLPFRIDNPTPEDQAIASGMRDVLIADLGRQPGINVLSRAAMAEPGGNRENLGRWSRDLGATLLVDGSLQRVDNDLKVVVALMRGSSVEWGGTYVAPADDVFSLQERVAAGLTTSPPLRAAASRSSDASAGTQDVEAFGFYGQASDFLERPDIAGNLQRAERLLLAALDRDRRFSLAWARLGETYWSLYEATRDRAWTLKATSAISEALRLDPDQALVRITLAHIYHGTGRSDDAIEELNRALALQPNSDEAHRLLGQVLQQAGRPEEAAVEYRQAIDLRPNYWRNHSMLGALYVGTGRYPEALEAFTRVTVLQPDNARGFHNAATVYYYMGDHENALAYYEKAIAVSPMAPMAESYSGAGAVYYHQGRYNASAEAFARAIELSPKNGLLHGNLGDAYTRLNRRQDARKAYAEAVELDLERLSVNPNDATVLARVAVNQAKLGRKADAERHATRAVELRENDGEVLYRWAVVRALNGEIEAAFAALEQALQHGYSSAIASRDHDLASIRETARFKEIMAAYPETKTDDGGITGRGRW